LGDRPPFFILTKIPGNTYIFPECRDGKKAKAGKRAGNYGVYEGKFGL
jgi:hypothetical protein